MNQTDLIIFDCDGVLVDSEIIAARAEAELLTQAGFDITSEEIFVRYSGLTFKDMLLRIEKDTGILVQASLIDRAEALIDRRLASDVRAIEGAAQAAAQLSIPRCVASNSNSQRLDMMLSKTGLKTLFAGRIFSAFDTPSRKPKPAPDVFLHAAASLGVHPSKALVIEDSVHGIHGAVAAGMRVIGFTGGAHSYPGHADRLTEAGAITVIRRWADLQAVVGALAEWSEAV
jgi:HAD superfamily hydrolase (TIGR01509 family)